MLNELIQILLEAASEIKSPSPIKPKKKLSSVSTVLDIQFEQEKSFRNRSDSASKVL